MKRTKVIEWRGCYDGGWTGEITEASFKHPAKYARKLIQRIYAEALKQGWIKPGGFVVDPFGGVALGARDAILNDLRWVGCELEPAFQREGIINILNWQNLAHQLGKGRPFATLFNGDSRKLCEVIGAASTDPAGKMDMAVSSPPFLATSGGGRGIMDTGYTPKDGKPFASDMKLGERTFAGKTGDRSPGNLELLPDRGFDLAVSSPPYGNAVIHGRHENIKPTSNEGRNSQMRHVQEYGNSDGQLGKLAMGNFDLSVSSPPYETISSGSSGLNHKPAKKSGQQSGRRAESASQSADQKYGGSKESGQLAKQTRESFWLASRQIVEQVFMCLKPGGYAVWVTKDFVKARKRVPFSDNWQKLCESVGLVPHRRIRAMVTEVHGTQILLDGGEHQLRTEKKSFFRRMAEKKGAPPIDWEDVIVMRKPL